MRVSAKGEYAAKAVLYLSLKHPSLVCIHEIAERHSIPVKYLEHILLSLKKAGVLRSERGVRGGYRLAREPQAISVGEVLRVVDGNFSGTGCSESSQPAGYLCPEMQTCGLKQLWQDVGAAVNGLLFQTTFEQLRQQTLAGMVHKSDFTAYEI
jgi:Rrf2 family protein